MLAQHGPQAELTFKWKVAAAEDAHERRLLTAARAIAGDRPAAAGCQRGLGSRHGPPLDGLWRGIHLCLAGAAVAGGGSRGPHRSGTAGPVALDESLDHDPTLRQSGRGGRCGVPPRRGPRPLLQQLQAGCPQRMLSTAFETGIGRRWLDHLAALQWLGPTPAAPAWHRGGAPMGCCSARSNSCWAALVNGIGSGLMPIGRAAAGIGLDSSVPFCRTLGAINASAIRLHSSLTRCTSAAGPRCCLGQWRE